MVELDEPAGKDSTSVSVEVLVTRAVGHVSGGASEREQWQKIPAFLS